MDKAIATVTVVDGQVQLTVFSPSTGEATRTVLSRQALLGLLKDCATAYREELD